MRISGPDALQVAAAMFHPASQADLCKPNLAQFGRVFDGVTGETIDEAILVYFKAPHSYTGEEVVELSCHGSPVVLRRVLELILARGARLAEPGEFTFRAFLNRRIDLAQAQAVRDIINAQTEYQAQVATRQLGGELSTRLAPVKDLLVDVIVHLESAVEFVEEDISPENATVLLDKIERVIKELDPVAASFALGRVVKEGFDLAIVGRANVGKSSVFNRLVGSDRAIVTEIAGTTRDALYETTSISGVPVRMIDTAGIRETVDVVENIGIRRSRAAIADAGIALVVLDGSETLTADDAQLIEQISPDRKIIAINKSDLPDRLDIKRLEKTVANDFVRISALTGEGFDLLTRKIFERLAGDSTAERDDVLITDARHHAAVRQAIDQMADARELIIRGELEEIILLRLHAALTALGEITGETLTDDILGQIFSTFCVGK